MAAAETARLLAALDLNDSKFQSGIRRTLGSLGKLDKGVGSVGRSMGRLGKGLGKGALVIGAGAVTGLTLAAKAAIDYQEAFQGVVKTVDAGPNAAAATKKFKEISDSLRQLSTEMPISAIALAGVAEAAGAMGIKADDITSFTKQVAILATTTNVSADDAATALGQLTGQIGLLGPSLKDPIGDFQRFAAALVDLGNKGSSTESQILDVEKRAGGFARSAGLAKEQTLGWAAATANIFGDRTEMGGTALAKFFNTALGKINDGGASLKTFAKVAGENAQKFKKHFGKDASGALEKFVKGLSKLKGAERLKIIQQLFGKGTGTTKLITDLANDIDHNLTPSLKNANKAWFEGTAAQEEFNKRNETVRSAITRLKNGLIDAAVSIGEGFTPALGRASDKLAKFLKDPDNRKALQDIGKDIGKAIDEIDWDKLLSAAKSLGSAFKPALEVITKIAGLIASLPPGVIGGAGALVITDKVTGGAVSAGIGGIVGGLGAALAKSLAASIPVFGRAFVQPVLVTNFPPGGLGGPGAGAGGAGAAGGMGLAAFIGTAGIGAVIGTAAAGLTRIIGQTIGDTIFGSSGSKRDFFGIGIEQSLSQSFGGFAALSDLPHAIDKMTTGVTQLQTFINSPHPDFLGDLGQLLLGNGPTQPTGPTSRDKGSEAAGTQAWKSLDTHVVPAVVTLRQQLKHTIEQEARADRRGNTANSARLERRIEQLKAKIRDAVSHNKKPVAPPKPHAATAQQHAQNTFRSGERDLFGPKPTKPVPDREAERGFATLGVKQDATKNAFVGSSKAIETGVGRLSAAARTGLDNATAATRSGTSGTTAATNVGASRIVGAIAANRPIVTTNTSVLVTVTASGVQKTTTTSTQYGDQNGSAGGGGSHSGAGGSRTPS